MKHKAEELKKGDCFICKTPCDVSAYCHLDCAIALSDERQKRQRIAQAMTDGVKKEEQKDGRI